MIGSRNDSEHSLTTLQKISNNYAPIHGYLSLLVCIIGSVFNLVTIFIFRNKQMVSPINRLLLAIAAVNLLIMLSYIPFALLFFIIYGQEESQKRNTYSAICYLLFHVLWTNTFHSTSVWLTLSVALFRFIHLTLRDGKNRCDLSKANLTIFLSIVGAILINIPQTLVYSIKRYDDEEKNTSWYYLSTDNDKYGDHANINLVQFALLALLVKITPCILLVVLSIILIRIIHSAHRKYTAMQRRRPSSIKYTTSPNEERRQRQTNQTTQMLIAIILVFVVIELPQGILFVLSGLLVDFFDDIYWPLGNFWDLLTIIGCCINFFLYCRMSSQFCQLLLSILRSISFRTEQNHDTVSTDL
ncbi:G-protein coupled receptor dmsr-1-like [Watersipora subatra]|uniref:G-protein coupled receptor dmsr-1-like n=1 Tax=Watersipora subatra TaxID=2589382 RepID=UPI00355B07DB